MLISGKCHCGNITLELEWDGDPPEIPARACGCSFCMKHGGVWTSNARSRLVVTIRDASLVSKYAFGTRTATFHVCSHCGTCRCPRGQPDDSPAKAIISGSAIGKCVGLPPTRLPNHQRKGQP